jgi:tetratricopeptide (TPR) repeat protein
MASRLNLLVAAVLPLSRLKATRAPSGGSEPRMRGAWGLLLLLAGCGLMQTSTEDAMEMQRNALSAYEGGHEAKAEALYLGLLKLSPNDSEAWLRLGNLYARSGRPDSAADAYQRGLLLAPSDARLWYNLGVIRQRQTLAAYIQALELTQPGDAIYENSEGQIKLLAPSSEKATTADENNASRK